MITNKISLLLCLCLCGPQAYAQTLQELYHAACVQTATLKQSEYSVQIAREKKKQATAAIMPSITAHSDNVWRDEANVGPFGEGYQRSSYLSLAQPLFQGGSEYYSLKVAKSLPQIAELEKQQQELKLFTEIAEAFFEVLKIEQDKKTLFTQLKTLEDRVSTLSQRAKIGRSKSTEVLAAMAQASRVTADLSLLESQRVLARQKLKNITGVNQLENLKDDFALDQLKIAEEWEEQLMQTPVIRMNELVLTNLQREVQMANANHLPSLDVDARYYIERAGILRDSDWDITLNARWNLFAGGRDQAEKRVQSLEAMSLELQLKDLKRNLENDFKALKEQFNNQRNVIAKLRIASQLAEENYRQHLIEVDRGLVNNLELLQVLDDYQQVRRSQDQQIYEAKKTWMRLRALAGVRP